MTEFSRFDQAIRKFDEANSRDPNTETVNGQPQPRELIYAGRLTDWVMQLNPSASEALRLAARCQHICRWEIPRNSYPMTKPGYLLWRADLKKFHAQKAGEILKEAGYDDETIRQVQELNLKKHISTDAECQTLEDALCLIFLQHQLAPLAARSDDEKMINALQKSWKKMSAQGRAEALKLNYGAREKGLIEKALAP
ncbi:MAG: DUF4202 domain-containing protein [Verrucomicrobia bacterium]|nr:DUF4202 domain-containing protein [Verrucomicrobiota bacterium]